MILLPYVMLYEGNSLCYYICISIRFLDSNRSVYKQYSGHSVQCHSDSYAASGWHMNGEYDINEVTFPSYNNQLLRARYQFQAHVDPI